MACQRGNIVAHRLLAEEAREEAEASASPDWSTHLRMDSDISWDMVFRAVNDHLVRAGYATIRDVNNLIGYAIKTHNIVRVRFFGADCIPNRCKVMVFNEDGVAEVHEARNVCFVDDPLHATCHALELPVGSPHRIAKQRLGTPDLFVQKDFQLAVEAGDSQVLRALLHILQTAWPAWTTSQTCLDLIVRGRSPELVKQFLTLRDPTGEGEFWVKFPNWSYGKRVLETIREKFPEAFAFIVSRRQGQGDIDFDEALDMLQNEEWSPYRNKGEPPMLGLRVRSDAVDKHKDETWSHEAFPGWRKALPEVDMEDWMARLRLAGGRNCSRRRRRRSLGRSRSRRHAGGRRRARQQRLSSRHGKARYAN